MKIFRFDDICIETDMPKTLNIVHYIQKKYDAQIIFGISPLTYDRKDGEDFIDREWLARSDHKIFYKIKNCGLPPIPKYVTRASHGLIHVDHRLLSKEVQELSILTSCSLVDAKIYIPPFNKWNKDTEDICKEYNIILIKYEDGWRCCEYNNFDSSHNHWYLHSQNYTLDSFKKWMNNDTANS